MSAYQVIARNFSTRSENRMHSDEMASRYGFRGALVPGIAIYGHNRLPIENNEHAKHLQSNDDGTA